MMRSLFTEEKVILNLLANRWRINLYDLYRSESISLAQIVQFIKLYEEIGYIRRFRYTIFKTIKGYFKIKRIAPELYRMSDTSWKHNTAEYFMPPLSRNEFTKKIKFKDFK